MALKVGERVRAWRIALGVSQKALARRVRMYNSRLCRIEKGETPALAADVEKIAKALGLTMPEFYGDEPREAA